MGANARRRLQELPIHPESSNHKYCRNDCVPWAHLLDCRQHRSQVQVDGTKERRELASITRKPPLVVAHVHCPITRRSRQSELYIF